MHLAMLLRRNYYLRYLSVSDHMNFAIILMVAILAKLVTSEQCTPIEYCKCKFQNGSIVDLTSLGYHDKPRWKDIKPTLSTDNYTYSYNPCFAYSTGNDGDCQNVEVCQTSKKGQHFNCGTKAHMRWNNEKNSLILDYIGTDSRSTNVTLVCSPEASTPSLVVIGEKETSRYEMTLTSRCACADLCSDHLSTGSVLVILFMIGVVLYLILGIIHSSLTRGAHGWELIPHYEFWSEFPLLVRDGCVFVINGCKPESVYEKI